MKKLTAIKVLIFIILFGTIILLSYAIFDNINEDKNKIELIDN